MHVPYYNTIARFYLYHSLICTYVRRTDIVNIPVKRDEEVGWCLYDLLIPIRVNLQK